MRHHEYEIELPFSTRRLWALFQSYDLWKEYAPAVLDVEIVYPDDADGNDLLRRVVAPGLSGNGDHPQPKRETWKTKAP
jgi:hypothetical protein